MSAERRNATMAVLLSLGAGVILALSVAFAPETLPPLELCWFRRLTGMPCGGCGMTRAFCSISHGHFMRAWEFNPFSFILYPFCVLVLLWPLLAKQFPSLRETLTTSRFCRIAPLVLAVALLVFSAARALSMLSP